MQRNVPFWYVLPALALYALIRVYPMFQSLFYSFTDWNGMSAYPNFVGPANFAKLARDPTVLNSIGVTLRFAIIVVVLVNAVGLVLAVLLNQTGKLTTALRSIIFLPVVISQVAVGFIWKNLYSYNGLLNWIATAIVPGTEPIGWLTDRSVALLAVALTEVWRTAGFHMVILLAALQTIPPDLYEAADIDGCAGGRRFFTITLPLLLPGLGISVVLSSIGALKQFGLVKILTDGGPLRATETLSLKILDEAFNYNFQGYAAAIAVVLFVAILLLVLFQFRFFSRRETEY